MLDLGKKKSISNGKKIKNHFEFSKPNRKYKNIGNANETIQLVIRNTKYQIEKNRNLSNKKNKLCQI